MGFAKAFTKKFTKPLTASFVNAYKDAAAAVGGDSLWANVVLLALNDSAANASTTFADQSSAAHAMTAIGNAQYSTTNPPTGLTSSGLFDGTGDGVQLPVAASLQLGTGDFCIEAYIRPDGATNRCIMGNRTGAGGNTVIDFQVSYSVAGCIEVHSDSVIQALSAGSVIAAATWQHVAYTRSGNTFTLWVNGISVDTGDATGVNFNNAAAFRIGMDGARGFTAAWLGKIASMRITKGNARYTAAFTPPALPLPTS